MRKHKIPRNCCKCRPHRQQSHILIHSLFVALNIRLQNESKRNLSLHDMLLQRTITPAWTEALNHPIIRRGSLSKKKQARVEKSKVTFNRCHLILHIMVIVSINFVVITTQHRVPEVSGLSHDVISNYWLCTQVSYALSNLRRDTHIPKQKHRGNVMHTIPPKHWPFYH